MIQKINNFFTQPFHAVDKNFAFCNVAAQLVVKATNELVWAGNGAVLQCQPVKRLFPSR